jgi:hypothetical protein
MVTPANKPTTSPGPVLGNSLGGVGGVGVLVKLTGAAQLLLATTLSWLFTENNSLVVTL